MFEEITEALWQASEQRRSCRVRLRGEPLTRTIHPYGVCRTARDKIVLVCWQSMGFTAPGRKEGFRNLLLEDFEDVEGLDNGFVKEEGFDPTDPQYKDWVFHI